MNRFQGFNHLRTQREPDERKFARQWKAHNDRPITTHTTLAYLLAPKSNGRPDEPELRDYQVAATVIQWLGSSVGQAFLKDCGFVKKPDNHEND